MARADRARGHRPSQPRPVPRPTGRHLRRRRSRAGRDRRAHLHPSRPAAAVQRARRLSDVERHQRGDHLRRQPARRNFRAAAASTATCATLYPAACSYDLTQGKTQIQLCRRRSTHDQRHSGGLSSPARRNTSSGVVDVGVVAYAMGAGPRLSFRHADAGGQGRSRSRRCSIRCAGSRPAEAAAIRPRIIEVVTVRRGDTRPVAGARMAYRDFQARAVPVAQRAAPPTRRWCRGRRSSWSSTASRRS